MTSEEKLTMQDEPAPKSVPKSKELESKEEIEFKRSTVKRTKHLFLLFLRQFDVMEYEIVVRFLRVLLEKHRKEPIKIFGMGSLAKLTSNHLIIGFPGRVFGWK